MRNGPSPTGAVPTARRSGSRNALAELKTRRCTVLGNEAKNVALYAASCRCAASTIAAGGNDVTTQAIKNQGPCF